MEPKYDASDIATYARMITVKGKKEKPSTEIPLYFVIRIGDKEIVPLPSGNYRTGEQLEFLKDKLRIAKLPEGLIPATQTALNALQKGLGDDYVQAQPEVPERKGLESLTA